MSTPVTAAPPISKKRKASMLYPTIPKHARLSTSKSVVKQLMFSRRQANVNNTAKSDIIEVEKYVVKTNQNLQYWLPDLQLTKADK